MPPLRPIPHNPTRVFPLLIVVALIGPTPGRGQDPAPAPVPAAAVTSSAAETQVDFSIVKLRLMERASAEIEQQVEILNQKFTLRGEYYKETDHRLRLTLDMDAPGDTPQTRSKSSQVCDGKVLWDYQQTLGGRSYRRREITPILQKLADPGIDPTLREQVINNLGFGGPEALVAGLRQVIRFDQISEGKEGDAEVWIVGGTWKDRSKLTAANGQPLPPTAPLPPYIPSNVRLFIGKTDGWPHRVEMIGNAQSLLQEDTRQIDRATGRPVGVKRPPPKVDPSRITLLYKLKGTGAVDPGLFQFQPPADVASGSVPDDTQEFLNQLDMIIQAQANAKKAEAAQAGDSPPIKPLEPGPEPIPPAEPANPAPAPK